VSQPGILGRTEGKEWVFLIIDRYLKWITIADGIASVFNVVKFSFVEISKEVKNWLPGNLYRRNIETKYLVENLIC
jgi:hypothetical protein